MQLKRIIPFAVIGFCLLISSRLDGLKFVPIYEPLTIKAQKNSPPYIAFEEMIAAEKSRSDWARLENAKPTTLAVDKNSQTPLYTKRIQLAEMVVTKTVEMVISANENSQQDISTSNPAADIREVASSQDVVENNVAENSTEWMKQLPLRQAYRLEEANRRSEVLTQKWDDVPTWSEMAKQVLAKAGVNAKGPSSPPSQVYVAATDALGQVRSQIPQNDISIRPDEEPYVERSMMGSGVATEEPSVQQTVVGPLEITGGLAVTNEHHIEIRRSDEGILKEAGKVNLRDGVYNITVPEKSGTVIARLVTKEGKTLGEGSFRLSRLVGNTSSVTGPAIKITPITEFAAIAGSAYNISGLESAPTQTRATFVKGQSEYVAKKDGLVAMENVTRGSSTVMRTAAPGYLQTASIIISGKEAKTPLYSENMIAALEDIVAQQRTISLEGAPTIIWGKVSLDGKTLSGISVSNESDPGSEAIYFNQFMIPDPNLKATGENGLYAFVGATPGFHSLLATRADSIFGYQNVIVEDGSVAQGDIENTMNIESIPMRVYDAFTGEARPATVTMQSLAEDISVLNGVATITLPQVSRLGLMRVKPEGADYVAARYLYHDNDNFVHVPLVQWSWLSAIKTYLRLDDLPTAGVIVGFVPDENFEVYLAGYDRFEPRQIVYFDMQGRILQNNKGIAGGGFILYNVPEDTHEVIVLGNRTQKIYSRVLPVDANSLSVLNFRE